VIVPVGLNGRIRVGAVDADLDVVLDVQGYFSGAWNTSSYTYDGTGLRMSKSTTDGPAEFSWDRSGGLPLLLAESNGASEVVWVYGPGGVPLEQVSPNGVVWFLHHDQVGSIRAITSSSGWELAEFTYDPYGNVTHATGTARSPFGYAGQYTDFETGFQYLRARFYDPATGVFLSRDPIESLTREPYGYVGNNPLNYTDPSGLLGIPGTNWCVDIADDNCNSIKEQHPVAAQSVADGAAGVLDTVSGSNSDLITESIGIDDNVRWNSTSFQVGTYIGFAPALVSPSGFLSVSNAGSYVNALDTTLTCVTGSGGPRCGISTAFAIGGAFIPSAIGNVAARLDSELTTVAEMLSGIFLTSGNNTLSTLNVGDC